MKRLYFLSFFVGFLSYSQNLYILNNTFLHISNPTLFYNKGGLKLNNSGRIDNFGNFMLISRTENDKFETSSNGGNFILKLIDPVNYTTSKYGQLYISGFTQTNLNTAIVDKEYRATKAGSMQQMALPFYDKKLSSLATDLGATFFSDFRNTGAVGYWENERAVMHNLLGNTTGTSTLSNATLDNRPSSNYNATRYYSVGTKNWNPSLPATGNYYTVKGIPFSDIPAGIGSGVTENMSKAGYISINPTVLPILYGNNGTNLNIYNERYNSYLQDSFDATNMGYFNSIANSGSFDENGTFGRNIYQFGNPFLTNLDLSHIGHVESATIRDNNSISNIKAIRYESNNVTTGVNGTKAGTYKYVTFNTDGSPAGDGTDPNGFIIKPMQAFVIKLRNNTPQVINFNTLRTFSSVPRNGNVNYSVLARNKKVKNTLKQIRVIALDSQNNEVGRTYYVVGQDLISGTTYDSKIQATTKNTIINTSEESFSINNIANYYLYINEANEKDFYGMPISLNIDNSQVSQLLFQLAEDGLDLPDHIKELSNNESFWIKTSNNGEPIKITNNSRISVNQSTLILSYGNKSSLSTNENIKKSTTYITYDNNLKCNVIFFKDNMESAQINIYDEVGRIIKRMKSVKTNEPLPLDLPINNIYVVKIIYKNGEIFTKKILNQ